VETLEAEVIDAAFIEAAWRHGYDDAANGVPLIRRPNATEPSFVDLPYEDETLCFAYVTGWRWCVAAEAA
jgi:hypothetical protein